MRYKSKWGWFPWAIKQKGGRLPPFNFANYKHFFIFVKEYYYGYQ